MTEEETFEIFFKRICKEDDNEACLFALSTLSLRHINKKNKEQFATIDDVLSTYKGDNKKINSVKDIIKHVKIYDEKLIKNLSDIEATIAKTLRKDIDCNNSKSSNIRAEEQRKTIKDWWK